MRKGEHMTEERRAMQSRSAKKQWKSGSEAQEKVKAQLRARNKDPEFLKLLSETRRLNWKDQVYRNKVVKAVMKACHATPNKSELLLGGILNSRHPGEYEYTGDGKVVIDGLCPDFTNVSGKNQVIELFGDYFHKGENLQGRIDKYAESGFNCLIIWEHDLKDIDSIALRMKQFREADMLDSLYARQINSIYTKAEVSGVWKFRKGCTVWNKGLTKETDDRVRTIGEKVSKAKKGKPAWSKGRIIIAKVKIYCLQCSKEFLAYPSATRKFCCKGCSTSYSNLHRSASRKLLLQVQ